MRLHDTGGGVRDTGHVIQFEDDWLDINHRVVFRQNEARHYLRRADDDGDARAVLRYLQTFHDVDDEL